jgi:polygalacturonase
MQRRDLLKLSPLTLVSASIGQLAPGQSAAPAEKEALFNVRTCGATDDGKTVDTPAINKAIEAVAAAGGGTLEFPAETYICFTIRLKSMVDLYLSRGVTILAADSPKPGETSGYNGGAYDSAGPAQPWEDYQDYGHNHWPNSLFYGENIDNFSITGPSKDLSRGGYGSATGPVFMAEQPRVGNKTIALNFGLRHVTDFRVLWSRGQGYDARDGSGPTVVVRLGYAPL